jgi:hypothetical protein
MVQWLLPQGGATVSEMDMFGNTTLSNALDLRQLVVVDWMLVNWPAMIDQVPAALSRETKPQSRELLLMHAAIASGALWNAMQQQLSGGSCHVVIRALDWMEGLHACVSWRLGTCLPMDVLGLVLGYTHSGLDALHAVGEKRWITRNRDSCQALGADIG